MNDKEFILLVGPMGCGKSTYCQKHLAGHFRISQDDMGKEGHMQAFRDSIASGAPRIVLDRCNPDREKRDKYLMIAKRAEYKTKIVWFNEDRKTCINRIQHRKNHPTLKGADAEVALDTYHKKFQAPSNREADSIVIIGKPDFVRVHDITDEIGDRRHVIVGDLHGCLDELIELLAQQEFDIRNDVLVSVGDIVDRGPKIRETVEFVMALPRFHSVMGNHDDKFLRWMQGRKVQVGNSLKGTIDSFGGTVPDQVRDFFAGFPLILKTPSGYCVHAGFDPLLLPEQQKKEDCLYMRCYGGSGYSDDVGGKLWYKFWPWNAPRVFYGHIAENGPIRNNLVSLDEGAVFGGRLRCFDSRDGGVYSVEARKQYSVPHASPGVI